MVSSITWLVFSVLAPKSIRRSRSIVVPLAKSSWVRKAAVSSAALSVAKSASLSGAVFARSMIPMSSAMGTLRCCGDGVGECRLRFFIHPTQ